MLCYLGRRFHKRLLEEYLIGSTYVSIKQHPIEAELLRLLPLTTIPSYFEEKLVRVAALRTCLVLVEYCLPRCEPAWVPRRR